MWHTANEWWGLFGKIHRGSNHLHVESQETLYGGEKHALPRVSLPTDSVFFVVQSVKTCSNQNVARIDNDNIAEIEYIRGSVFDSLLA